MCDLKNFQSSAVVNFIQNNTQARKLTKIIKNKLRWLGIASIPQTKTIPKKIVDTIRNFLKT